jgi:DNA-binding response OmpR family regulator
MRMPAKILIVDDDLQSLKLIGLMLQRRGYLIDAARGGAQALAKADADVPDLVILDVMMPDMDGLEVCRRLRADPKTSRVPIIMFTAKILVSDKVDGFQAGADDYLTKPIHPNELAARVETALQRSLQIQPPPPLADAGQVIGFFGVKGGVGTTTLALNVAAALVNTPAPRRVILADLQSSAANIAVQLSLDPSDGLSSLINYSPQEITPALAGQHLLRHASGIQLLLSGQDLRANLAALPTPQITAIINSLSQIGQLVLLDLGSTLDESTLASLNLCQRIVLALEPQRVAVTVAQNLIAQLDRRGIPSQRLIIALINRTPGAVALDKRAIEDMLRLTVSSLLPPVPEVASQAANDANLIIQLQPGSLIADQFRSLAQRLTT